jgi:DNA-directed RNA polymerase specialized sigma24 family protein
MLFMETLKEQQKQRQALDHLSPSIQFTEDHTEKEERINCFESCLNRLPDESRRLIVSYYEEDRRAKIERRKLLAEQLEIPLNALRIRVHRIRMQLEQCVRACLQSGPVGEMK